MEGIVMIDILVLLVYLILLYYTINLAQRYYGISGRKSRYLSKAEKKYAHKIEEVYSDSWAIMCHN
jgi:hypothetical protein